MKKKLISTLICAVFTFTLIGTSLPAYAVEESVNSQEKEKMPEDEDNLSYGNTELTEDDYKWMEENMENKTSEIFQKAYGDKASNKKVRAAFFNDSAESPLPQSKDLSSTDWFPEIGNQGDIGSCAAFAAVYYQMSYAVNKSLNNGEKLTFSPKWIYNITNDGHDCGSNVIENYKAIQKYGALTLYDYPYINSDSDSKNYTSWSTKASDWLKAQQYSIDNNENGYCYSHLNIFTNPNTNTSSDTAYIDSIKTVLNEENIVNISIFARSLVYDKVNDLESASNKDNYKDKVSSKFKNENIVQYAKNTYKGSHAVTIVGYDDTIWTDINKDNTIQPSELGAFKVANSWGKNGSNTNEGFFWVSYDALNRVSQIPAKENASDSELAYKNSRAAFINDGELEWINSPSIKERIAPIYAEFTLNTNMRHECKVTLSAKNITTNEVTTYSDFNPFGDNSYGYLSFDGSCEKNDGSFAIDLSRVIPNINSESLNSYIWTLTVSDTESDDNCVLVKDFKIVDENTKKKYRKNFKKYVTLDYSSENFTINPNELPVNITSVCLNSPSNIPFNKVSNIYCLTSDGNDNNYKFKFINNTTGKIDTFDTGDKNNIDWIPYETGDYSVYVTVTDSYGNTDTNEDAALTLTVEEKDTDSSILSPENLTYTLNSDSVTLNWGIKDSSNIKNYAIYKNGQYLTTTETTSYTDKTNNNSKSCKYTVKAIRNDVLYGSCDINVPNSNNDINLFLVGSEKTKTIYPGDTVSYTIDSAGGIGNVTYSCELVDCSNPDKKSAVIQPIPGTNTYTWTAETPGEYYLSFMAADSNNNISNNVYPLIKVQDKNTEKVTVTPDKSFSLRGFTFKEDSSDYADINLILKWDKPKENVDIYKYKIYCNDEYLGETNERIFRCLGHERDENYYNYKVVALDADGNILATSNFFTI